MKQFSQINFLGPSSIAIELREFTVENEISKSMTLDSLLHYIIDERKYTIGHSPRNSDYYGPYLKTEISTKNYVEMHQNAQDLLLQILDKLPDRFLTSETSNNSAIKKRLIKQLKDSNLSSLRTFLFLKSFYSSSEKTELFTEPILFDYFVSIVLLGQYNSWFITIWYD